MERIEWLARREGEALAQGRLAVLRHLGLPIPQDWLDAVPLAAYVAAEDLHLESVDVTELAESINKFAATAWSKLARAGSVGLSIAS